MDFFLCNPAGMLERGASAYAGLRISAAAPDGWESSSKPIPPAGTSRSLAGIVHRRS